MFEEPFYLTKTEAEYCLLIAGITAGAGRGTDIGAKAEALIGRLEAEMKKPEGSQNANRARTGNDQIPVRDSVSDMAAFRLYQSGACVIVDVMMRP